MDTLITGKKTIAEVSLATRLLYERLKELAVGEVASYKELSQICGRNVQEDGVGLLNSARNICLREHQIVFSPIINEGLKRLSDSEIVRGADADIGRIRRAAKKGMRKLACASYKNLEDAEKNSFNAKAAVLGTLAQHATPAQLKQVERAYANEAKPILPGVSQ